MMKPLRIRNHRAVRAQASIGEASVGRLGSFSRFRLVSGVVASFALLGIVIVLSSPSGASARHQATPSARDAGSGSWVSTWAAGPQPATLRNAFPHGLDDQTVRNIV